MRLRLLLALGAGVLLAACGDDDPGETVSTTTVTERTITDPAPAATTESAIERTGDITFFRTGDGIGCAVAPHGARCDVLEPEWKPPPPDEPCSLDYGNAVAVGRQGPATFSCVGDTVIDPASPELGEGEFVEVLGYRCENAGGAVSCSNLGSGAGFTVSRETVEVR